MSRCLMRACPWRFRTGADRICPLHQADADTPGLADRAAAYGAVMASPPGERGGGIITGKRE
jgi:hypothetical protein